MSSSRDLGLVATAAAAASATVAAEHDQSEDDEPYPVVVKKLAKAVRVVIHNVPP